MATPSSARAVVAVLALCGASAAMMQTLVVPLLPVFPDLLGTGPGEASWVMTSTVIASAAAVPTMGRLADQYGKRNIIMVSLSMMVVGSVVCALSDSLAPLLLGRSLQGMSIAVVPIGISVAHDVLPAERVGGGIALISATLGIGAGLGLPLAGLITEIADWHSVFWAAAALGATGLLLVALVIPDSAVRHGGRFDLLGALLLSASLALFLLPVSKAADWGLTSRTSMLMLGLAAIGGAAWVVVERRTAEPMINLAVMARGPVLVANLASLFLGFAMFANAYAPMALLQLRETTGYGFGLSIGLAGLLMLPGGIIMAAMAPVSARLSAARGGRFSLIVGAGLVAAGHLFHLFFHGSMHEVVVGVLVGYAGVGIAYGALPTVVMQNVPVTDTATANAITTLARAIGLAIASASISAILAAVTTLDGAGTVPSRDAFRITFIAASVTALLAAGLAAALPRRGLRD